MLPAKICRYGPDILSQIRKAATRDGLVVVMHANGLEAQKAAVDACADMMAHGMWHWGNLNNSAKLPASVRVVLDRIADKRIGYHAKIQALYGESSYFDREYLNSVIISRITPKAMVELFRSAEGKRFGKALREEGTNDAAMLMGYEQGPVRRVGLVVKYLASLDADLLFGTDTWR